MPRMFLRAREPFSSYSHFLGAVLSGGGLLLLLIRMAVLGGVKTSTAVAAVIFCLSMIGLYTASAVYHFSGKGEAILRRLKKLDHSMIYVLIAGSYTPIVLKFMDYPYAIWFTLVIWGIALMGITVKLIWIDAPRFLGTALYLLLGWAIVWDIRVLLRMPVPALALLVAGGILYTVGGVVYILKRPNLPKGVGFHELFHLFVIGGSVCHYLLVLFFVI